MNHDQLIIRNSIRCDACGDEIVSAHRHDYVRCRCGANAVDGGDAYLRRAGGTWTDTSIVAVREQNDERAVAETQEILEGKRRGWRLIPGPLRDAPTLDAWRVVEIRRFPPKRVLVGVVSKHPDYPDGTLLATTGLALLEIDEGWARTTQRFYRLGGRQQ